MSPNVGTTFAVKKDGTVWAWGSNCFGYFSDSTIINSIVPVQIPNISDVKAISVPKMMEPCGRGEIIELVYLDAETL